MRYGFEDSTGRVCEIEARPIMGGGYAVALCAGDNGVAVSVTEGQVLEMLHVLAKALDEPVQEE